MTPDMSLGPPGFQTIRIQGSSLWSLDTQILSQIMYCQLLRRRKTKQNAFCLEEGEKNTTLFYFIKVYDTQDAEDGGRAALTLS